MAVTFAEAWTQALPEAKLVWVGELRRSLDPSENCAPS